MLLQTSVKIGGHRLANLKRRLKCVSTLGRMHPIVQSHPRLSTMSLNQSIGYRWIDGVERLELYEPGGYHPVMIDDLLHNRYRIVDKLGFGGYSTIWLARDEVLEWYVAVKVGISHPSFPRREADILRQLSHAQSKSEAQAPHAAHNANASIPLPEILESFEVHGPNGTHMCYTLTPAQGNLKEASFSRLFPIKVARALAAKLTEAVAYIHTQGIAHGGMFCFISDLTFRPKLITLSDLHLRNMLIKLPTTLDELSGQEFREKFGAPELVPVTRVDDMPLTSNVPAQAVLPLYLGKKAQEFTLADAQGLILSDFGEAFSPGLERRYGRDCHIALAKRAPEALFEPNTLLSYPADIWSLLSGKFWE